MVKVNGYFATITNGNNYLGHGFYQYSPELLYRIFSPENGFTVECMFLGTLANSETKETWYTVNDPDKVKNRINICNSKPVSIIMIARKIAEVDIFSVTPQQSDYQAIWDKAQSGQAKTNTTSDFVKMYRKHMPSTLKKLVYFFRKKTKRSQDLGEIDPAHINIFNF